MKELRVSKVYFYKGPSHYLDRQAMVFNLSVPPDAPPLDIYRQPVVARFPVLGDDWPDTLAELFCRVLVQVLKMDIDLFVNRWDLSRDGEDHVVAVEYLDEVVSEDAAHLVRDWLQALAVGRDVDVEGELVKLQEDFDRTLFGGPTLYSLVEAGLKRGIQVLYLEEENQLMWGYGERHVRGRSTTFHTDGIKDTEFTTFKDMVKEFLLIRGFPTPVGANCFTEEEAVAEAQRLGFPVVVKPVAGHKGQGVVTNIESEDEVRRAFTAIVEGAEVEGTQFDGAIVEQQVYGTDHRLLAVDGEFAAGLQRVPAFVDGDGSSTIEQLIARENDTEARLDNARSPMCKIKIDEDLLDYLRLQRLSLESVPAEDERVFLRRVANISAGGVSINVTDDVHPANVKLVRDIARCFQVTCLGIDVLAEDISKPWTDGNFGIIEINAGPGVFMHLAPAVGESVDVPGMVLRAHFPEEGSERVPIIAGNCLSESLCARLSRRLEALSPGLMLGAVTPEGVSFDGEHFFRNDSHFENVKIVLRDLGVGFAVFNHQVDDILDHGMVHQGADVVVLEKPHWAQEAIARDLLPGGYLVAVTDRAVTVSREGEQVASYPVDGAAHRDDLVLRALEPLLPELLQRYGG